MPDLFDSLLSGLLEPPAKAPHAAGPADELRSDRLLFRPLLADDAPAFHRLINDWEICRKLPDAPFPYPDQLARDWIAAAAADRVAGRAEQFAVVEEATGTMIGCAGLRLAKDKRSADLGYWLGTKYWRRGFGREVAQRLTQWGLAALNVQRITATVAADNAASLAVLTQAGFTETGKGTQPFQCRGGAKMPVLHLEVRHAAPSLDTDETDAPAQPTVLLVVAAALIDTEGRMLLARRPEGKKLAGLWEFPGGKMQPGELPEVACARELKEELGIAVKPGDLAPFTFASHAYEGFHLLMPLFLCRRWAGKPVPREGQALAWVAPDRLSEYPMPPADRPLIPMLRDFL